MSSFNKLSHSVWKCKYHIVCCPKYRYKILHGEICTTLRDILRQLCEWKKIEILEASIQPDHVHLVLSIPPKYSVAQVIGYIKGKSAIHIARTYGERKRNFSGQHFWARGYFVSTVGRDEEIVREYIRSQELEDRRLDQLRLL